MGTDSKVKTEKMYFKQILTYVINTFQMWN